MEALASMCADPECAATVAAQSGADLVASVMTAQADDVATVRLGCRVMEALAVHEASEAPAFSAVVKAVQAHPNDVGVAEAAVRVAVKVLERAGTTPSYATREELQVLAEAVAVHGSANANLAAVGATFTQLAADGLADGPVDTALKAIAAVAGSAAETCVYRSMFDAESGQVYYVHGDESTWETPTAVASFKQQLLAASEALQQLSADAVPTVSDTAQLRALVACASYHDGDAEVAAAAASMLAALAVRPSNAMHAMDDDADGGASAGGGMAVMLTMAENNAGHDDVQRDVLSTVAAALQAPTAAAPTGAAVATAIRVAVAALARAAAASHEALACAAGAVLAKTCDNSPEDATDALVGDADTAVAAAGAAMCAFPHRADVVLGATGVLALVLAALKARRGELAPSAGPGLCAAMRGELADDPDAARGCVVCMGMLASAVEALPALASAGMFEALSAVMAAALAQRRPSGSLMALCMQVLGRTAVDEEDLEEAGAAVAVTETMLRSDALEGVVKSLDVLSGRAEVVRAGVDALADLSQTERGLDVLRVAIGRYGAAPVFVALLNANDWDQALIVDVAGLLSAMSYSETCANMMCEAGTVEALATLLSTHSQHEDVMYAVVDALQGLAKCPASKAAFDGVGAVATLASTLQAHAASPDMAVPLMRTLERLCVPLEGGLSTEVADACLHTVLSILRDHADDTTMAVGCMNAVRAVCVNEGNTPKVAQHDGVASIVAAVCVHPEDEGLVESCIMTLDVMAGSSPEFAAIVVEEGGLELLKELMAAHSDNEDIQEAGASALAALETMKALGDTAKLGQGGSRKRPAVAKQEDPLAAHRHFLRAGQILLKWSKGSSKPVHLMVSKDFHAINFAEPKTHKVKGALDIRSLVAVVQEVGPGHAKGTFTRKAADPACALLLATEDSDKSVCLEASTPDATKRWHKALSAMLDVWTSTPHLLAPKGHG